MKLESSNHFSAAINSNPLPHESHSLTDSTGQLARINHISNSQSQIKSMLTPDSAEKKSVKFNDEIDIYKFEKFHWEGADNTYVVPFHIRIFRYYIDRLEKKFYSLISWK